MARFSLNARSLLSHPFFYAALPLLIFLIWIERNLSLPLLGVALMEVGLGLPWVFVEGGLLWSLSFNFILVAIWAWLLRGAYRFPSPGWASPDRPLLHGVFKGWLAASAFLILITLWQPSGIVLYQLIPDAWASSAVSFLLFWGFIFAAWKTRLTPRGVAFAAGALLLTPLLGLDRLFFGISCGLLWLAFRKRATQGA
jgi:hypothetical protein